MNNKYLAACLASVGVLLASCASSYTGSDIDRIETVGILNLFPDKPTYSKVGMTYHDIGEADLPGMKDYLSQSFVTYLEQGKVATKVVSGRDALTRGEVGMILEIHPRKREPREEGDAFRYSEELPDEGTNGYGFYNKSMMFLQKGPEAYVSMEVRPLEMRGDEIEEMTPRGESNRYKLSMGELPNGWRRVKEHEVEEMKAALERAIDETVEELLGGMGF